MRGLHMRVSNDAVTAFGAYGHTGRFVVSELRRRGWTPILSGRDEDKLNALEGLARGLDLRPANVDDAGSLDYALASTRRSSIAPVLLRKHSRL